MATHYKYIGFNPIIRNKVGYIKEEIDAERRMVLFICEGNEYRVKRNSLVAFTVA